MIWSQERPLSGQPLAVESFGFFELAGTSQDECQVEQCADISL